MEELKGPVPPPIPTHEIRAEKRKKQQKTLLIVGAIAAIILLVVAGYLFTHKPKADKVVASNGASETVKKTIAAKETGPSRIVITSLQIDEPIFDDDAPGPVTQDDLNKGVNYYDENTNKPGKGNVVLFGHSAVSSAHDDPFGPIGDMRLKAGDAIVLTDAAGKKYTYKVTDVNEIASTDFSYVRPLADDADPILTIITCVGPNYPKDKRLAVRAVLQK